MSKTFVQIGHHTDEEIIATYFEIVGSASGVIQFPQRSTLVLDAFQDLEEAVASTVASGVPTFNAAVDGSNNRCLVSLDNYGNYTISPEPSSYPIAILYRVKQPLSSFDPSKAVLEDVERAGGGGTIDSASNVGGGFEMFKEVSSADMKFRTLLPGTNVTMTQTANTVTINANAKSNTFMPGGW